MLSVLSLKTLGRLNCLLSSDSRAHLSCKASSAIPEKYPGGYFLSFEIVMLNSNTFTRLTSESLKKLQCDPRSVRNVCILAHVDHGKTTLADSLIATNGIISERLAGELRYLDSREDEQIRGITMKSSAVTLHFTRMNEGDLPHDYLINLIDSPGHVDFTTEVSTAVRLCDGAFVVVDVVEGAGPQTCAVLRQAWVERIRPVLVLNKIDRLFTELKMTPVAVYYRLLKVVEQVNAIIGQLFHSDLFENMETSRNNAPDGSNGQAKSNSERFDSWALGFDSIDDTGVYFQPELGNVIFASAVDKWAFSLDKFSKIYAVRLDCKEKDLLAALWGDFYYEASTKTFKAGAADKGKTPIFVKIVMENIWTIYDAVLQSNPEKLLKIISQLKLEVNERRLGKADNRFRLQSVLGKWLPLADDLLNAAVRHLPSPASLTETRVERLLSSQLAMPFSHLPENTRKLKSTFLACESSEGVPTVIFVSKLFPVPASSLSDSRRHTIETAGEPQVFLAFARVFSGIVRPHQKIYLIEPMYIPPAITSIENGDKPLPDFVQEVELGDTFFLMGREVEKIDEVRAGNVLGISGLDQFIFKSATLSTSLACPPFLPISAHSVPIVQVAIEPLRPGDDAALQTGLQLLNRSDPCVEVSVNNISGEFLIRTAGEVHLHRCLADLKERFAGIELRVSQPTVPFRETVTNPLHGIAKVVSTAEEGVLEPGIVRMSTVGDLLSITIRASPLPQTIVDLISSQESAIKKMHRAFKLRELGKTNELADENANVILFKDKLVELAKDCDINVNNILSFGPRHCGPNILTIAFDECPLIVKNVWSKEPAPSSHNFVDLLSVYNSILSGFQLAVSSGPICEEPMSGVCFTIVDVQLASTALDSVTLGSLNGQTVSLVKDCCRDAFSSLPQRLVVAMYTCTVQTTPETLGKLHGVISRRFGRVVNEDTNDTCSQFVITAVLPVIESFGLADELRKRTSGLVIDPQLKFSHWEVLDADPTTVIAAVDEEDEDESLEASLHFQARRYMLAVRRRKGLPTGEQLVVSAEKQRTLSKKK